MKKRERKRDETGMIYAGRAKDGRYLYAVPSVHGYSEYRVPLTQTQRVGFAILRRLAEQVRPGTQLYPFRPRGTRQYRGWGMRPGQTSWLNPSLVSEDLTRAFPTIAHELAHNVGLRHSSKGFAQKVAQFESDLLRVTKGGTVWPKLDMRKLRDTPPPSEKKRAAAKPKPTRTEKWADARSYAAAKVAEWNAKQSRAAKRLEHWSKQLDRAQRFLERAEQEDTGE